jgi:hypothetical protein
MMESACKPAAAPVDVRGGVAAFTVGAPRSRAADYLGNIEPSLDEILADEVIRRVMARDGIGADQVRALLEDVRERLG